MLRIKVRNLGRDAYKPEIYGESITIERKIGVDSSGGYKIENSRNKTVSSKKDELIAVLDHFNMQIDNPLNFLTQDTARQFLARSNPEDIYKVRQSLPNKSPYLSSANTSRCSSRVLV